MKFFKILLVPILLVLLSSFAWAAENYVVYYHNDALGSPVAATDEQGAVLWKEHYLPYGEKVIDSPESSNEKLGYTGKAFDRETGLNYYGARYYDPVVGRFMGIDPVGFQEDNIHSFNRYAYANNNPINFIDPDGRSARGPIGRPITGLFSTPRTIPEYSRATDFAIKLKGNRRISSKLSEKPKGNKNIQINATKGPKLGGGATLDKLSPSEIKRIQNAADRSGTDITVVGSRVNPNKALHSKSDFDFVIDANSKTRNNLSRSLPGSKNVSEGISGNQDIFKGAIDKAKPHAIFKPGGG